MGNRGRGRPPKYTDAGELQARIDAYFDSCRGHYRRDDTGAFVLDRNGRPILDGAAPITMTGLQIALGFRSRQSLCDYRGRREFAHIIERARLRVEQYAEESLFSRDSYNGAAFVLQNCFGWKCEAAVEEKPLPAVHIVNMDA